MEKNRRTTCCVCGNELNRNSVIFRCPACSKENIARCDHCRKVGVKYKCVCGFEGP